MLGDVTDRVDTLIERVDVAEDNLNKTEGQLKELTTPQKKEKKKPTEEQQRIRLEKAEAKRAARCAEMGVGAKKIPIGNIMEALRLSIKRIEEQVETSEVFFQTKVLSFILPFFFRSCRLLEKTVLKMSSRWFHCVFFSNPK